MIRRLLGTWQLALGGALMAATTGAISGDAVPWKLAVAVVLGAAGGAGVGVLVARTCRRLAAAAHQAGDDGGEALAAVVATLPGLLREMGHAVSELHQDQAGLATELREETRRLSAILDSITEGILVTDPQGRIALTNRALDTLFGVGRPAAGRRPVEVVRDAVVDDAIGRVLAGAGPVSCEIALGGDTGRHLEVHVAPLSGTGGTVAVFHDITRLWRLERTRADFVANVSHELRTPLTAIKGCAETLADGALHDPEAAARFVGVIVSHAERLATLLRDLLELSRLESDEAPVVVAEVPVPDIAAAARQAVSVTAAKKGIHVQVEVPSHLAARCDGRLVEQALVNLVDNAVKYTPEGGRVRISARRLSRQEAVLEVARRRWYAGPEADAGAAGAGAGTILVEVSDTGMGIPSEAVERVFERFYRVDKGRSRALGGTGLGLSIVRHVMHLHGQSVFVDSRLGQGSVFGFTLEAA